MTERETALRAVGVSIGYGSGPFVKDVSLDIPRGKFTVLLGPNGSGKSTLLKGLGGLLPTQDGQVLLDGRSLKSLGPRELARQIAMRTQGAEAPEGLTVGELVGQGRYPHRGLFARWSAEDEESVQSTLELTHLTS